MARRKTAKDRQATALWAPTVTPWSLQCHHPGPEVVDVEAAWGPTAPTSLTLPLP